MPNERTDLDRLQKAYKDAVEELIVAIRAEEGLATEDRSIAGWERWEQAGFKTQEAQDKATAAKEADLNPVFRPEVNTKKDEEREKEWRRRGS